MKRPVYVLKNGRARDENGRARDEADELTRAFVVDELVLKIIDAAEDYAPQPVKELKKRSKRIVESAMMPLF